MQPRQGRSLWLPTLPYQRTNRYAVDGAKLVFYLLQLRISYTNHYAVVAVMLALFYSTSASVIPTATK